jgi:serine/threonine protein kinase
MLTDSATLEAENQVVKPGELVAGKFLIESTIGVGGMGIVVLATHVELDERVALKFLRREAALRPDIVQRFSQEARAAVKLKSEHVARVLDVGTHNGLPFMVMEYLEGVDLRQYIDNHGAMDVLEACEFLIHACEGLGEAHARGIVHRDIKPENLFVVDRSGERMVKLLDFGISKVALTNRVTDVNTHGPTQGVMGSPYYMSPEQLRSTKEVDRRADIWGLGAVFFEMLTGETAFSDTQEFTELVAEILERPHRSVIEIRSDLSPKLQQIIDRCMAKNRDERYQSAVDLAPFVRSRARAIASKAVNIAAGAGFSKNLGELDSMPPPSLVQGSVPVAPVTALTQSGERINSRAPTSPEGALSVAASKPHAASSGPKPWMIALCAGIVLLGALLWGMKSGTQTPEDNRTSTANRTGPTKTIDPVKSADPGNLPNANANASAQSTLATVATLASANASTTAATSIPLTNAPSVASERTLSHTKVPEPRPGVRGPVAPPIKHPPVVTTAVPVSTLDIRRER